MKKITKQEKRQTIAAKLKAKQQRGATLGGQLQRTQTLKSFSGKAKKLVK